MADRDVGHRILPALALALLLGLALWGVVQDHGRRGGWVEARPDLAHGELLVPSGLKQALSAALEVVEGWRGEWLRAWPPREEVRQTLRWLARMVGHGSGRRLRAALAFGGRFLAWGGDDRPGEVLVTGYFVPALPASHERRPGFMYPLYGIPGDLVTVDLGAVDPGLPPRTITIRVQGHRGLPYPDRAEIERMRGRFPAPVLAWLPSALDGFLLQVQGSGRLLFPEDARTVHFAASNGRPYRSIGRVLVERGIMEAGEVTLQSLMAWLRAHPEEADSVLAMNPRYVFFRWGGEEVVGAYGAPLRAMASAALDPALYPPGAPLLLRTTLPGRKGVVALLLFNLDRGAAIKGPHRIDLFCGEGERALETAGRLKSRGRLYLLMKREKKKSPAG